MRKRKYKGYLTIKLWKFDQDSLNILQRINIVFLLGEPEIDCLSLFIHLLIYVWLDSL